MSHPKVAARWAVISILLVAVAALPLATAWVPGPDRRCCRAAPQPLPWIQRRSDPQPPSLATPKPHVLSMQQPRIHNREAVPSALRSTVDAIIATPESPTATAMKGNGASLSPAAQWHKTRRRKMLSEYGDEIGRLERDSSSQNLGLALLALSNFSLFGLALLSGKLKPFQIVGLAVFPGSMFSLWTLQILHDCLHGSLLNKGRTKYLGGRLTRKDLQDGLLFWGSMPSAFGYYLYLRYGHMTHHRAVGDPEAASLSKLFDSDKKEFEDGDVLFVAHRMKLKGGIGPKFSFGKGDTKKEVTLSISKSGFSLWKEGSPLRNSLAFSLSFLYERFMLVFNDAVVAVTGRNYFFPNKPKDFHDECAKYCRCAMAVRGVLWAAAGWKSILFLYLSETLWSIPPHPACAMFVTNHGSSITEGGEGPGSGMVSEAGSCIPSSSTYAGRWYSLFTLGTNYHCEHHDFPTIPLHRLGKLRKIAPEFYRKGSNDNVFKIMKKAFARPQFYACMDAGIDLERVHVQPNTA